MEEKSSRPSEKLLSYLSDPTLPVLVHNNVPFTDPWSICEYLDESFPHNPLMPKDPARRARARIWARWIEEVYFSEGHFSDSMDSSIEKQFKYLQGALTRRPYLVSSELSLIDLYVFPFIKSIKQKNNMKLNADLFPKLSTWYSRFLNENTSV